MIYFLTAIGLTPGGSSTVHIYHVCIPFNKHGNYRMYCFWLYVRKSYIAVVSTAWFMVTVYFFPGTPVVEAMPM